MTVVGASTMIDRARKVQAKNDVTGIVNSVNAYYTDYGKYPVDPNITISNNDVEYGNPDSPSHSNSEVMNVLRAIPDSGANSNNQLNPRQIQFFAGSLVRNANQPKGGFDANGEFWDPWGSPNGANSTLGHYIIIIDANYDGITQAYTLGNYSDLTYDMSIGKGVRTGVIAASLGKDQSYGTTTGTAPNGNYKYSGSDDILSWQ